MWQSGTGAKKFQPSNLIDLLHRGRFANATLPHDYCYGLLGLSRELGHEDLTVDYSLSVGELYKRLARFLVKQGHGIKLLYDSSDKNLILPSWVPDWSCRRTKHFQFFVLPGEAPVADPAYAAATLHPASLRVQPNMPDHLTVRGLVFDHVEFLGPIFSSELPNEYNKDALKVLQELYPGNNMSGSENSATQIHPIEWYRMVADCITEISQMLKTSRLSRYPTREDQMTVIWRTAICNLSADRLSKASPDYVENVKAFVALVSSLFHESWSAPDKLAEYQWEAMVSGGSANLQLILAMISIFVTDTVPYCMSRRRGRTKRGYVGQFPNQARVGDVVFVPLGSAFPFLIRQKNVEDDTYELIEECYVHGIMAGEGFHVRAASVKEINIV